jgi:23S rRNA-/tRNA-specific pseudouridylate synthase
VSKIRLHKKILELVRSNNLEYTAPEIARNIANYGIWADGELIKNRLFWTLDEQVLDFQHWPKRKQGNFLEVKILHQDNFCLVVFKPKNVVVAPGAGHVKDNLLVYLESEGYLDLYLVHRLDKDTQGILLIAKGQNNLEFFQEQFKNRQVTKKYLAVVDNFVDKLWITSHYQARDRQNPLKQKLFWDNNEALNYDDKAKEANTIIKPLFTSKELDKTLVEVEIKTGRMHQIRIVCQALGFPLFDEKLYNSPSINPPKIITENQTLQKPKDLNRNELETLLSKIFVDNKYSLLANFLRFKLPNNQILEIQIASF